MTGPLVTRSAFGEDVTTTVNFDDLPLGVLMTNQCEEEGVVFSTGSSSAKVVDADPPGTQSGTKAIEAVYSGDIPEHPGPIKFRFRTFQKRVKVYLGRRYDGDDPLTEAVIRAFGFYGDLLGKEYVALGGDSRPVRTALEVEISENRIYRVEVQYVRRFMLDEIEWETDTNGVELMDSLTFEGLPPPPPPDDEPPVVRIERPTSGQVFFGSEAMIRLEGAIEEDRGLSSLSCRISYLDAGGDPSTASLGWSGAPPELTFPDNPGLRLELKRGRNRITVTARDTRDQTDSETVDVVFASAPVIRFTTPADGFETASHEVLVQGTISKPYGTLSRSQVTWKRLGLGEDPTRVDTLSGSATAGYTFSAEVPLLDRVQRDHIVIHFEAVDEGGTVGSADLNVYSIHPNMISVAVFEVTQAVTSTHPIAGRTTAGRIVARTDAAATALLQNVAAELHGYRGGVELSSSPIQPFGPDEIDVDPSETTEERWADATKTWNFELPDSWVAEGTTEMVAIIDPENDLDECDYCEDDNRSERTFTFEAGDGLVIQPIAVSCLWNGVRCQPTNAEVTDSLEGIKRAYPYRDITILNTITYTSNVDLAPDTRTARRTILLDINDRYNCYDSNEGDFWGAVGDWLGDCEWSRYDLALMPLDPSGGCPGGVSFLNSPGAIAEATPWTAAHELGHALGRGHAGNAHGEAGGGGYDHDFPHEHGRTGSIGFDTTAWIALPEDEPYPAGLAFLGHACDACNVATEDCHAHDFMSYGKDPRWISEYTWRNIHFHGFGGGVRDAGAGQNLGQGGAGIPDAGAGASGDADREAGGGAAYTQVLHITGEVRPDGRVRFRPFYTAPVPDGFPPIFVGVGSFEARLLDAGKNLLASRRFDPAVMSDGEGQWISRLLPFVDGGASLEILRDGAVVETRKISRNPPGVSVLEPNGGESYGAKETILVRWKATDADGDKLTFGVQYTPDDGKSWHNLAFLLGEAELEVNLGDLPGGKLAKIQVLATDGVLGGRDASDAPFSVGTKPPYPTILRPLDGATIHPSDPVVLVGTASDREEVKVAGASLRWTSSRDGFLGTGGRLDAPPLSLGAHRITLEARDRSGATASTEIDVIVSSIVARRFIRGNADGDATVNITDPIYLLGFLFLGGPALPCDDAGDSNDDGELNISDAVYTLSFLFSGGPQPKPPFPKPGTDPTLDKLGCKSGTR